MPIKFTRQSDGSYLESGDFKVGTRTVQMFYDGVSKTIRDSDAKERLAYMREAIKQPQFLKAHEYELREVKVDSAELVARRVLQLVKARQARGKRNDSE